VQSPTYLLECGKLVGRTLVRPRLQVFGLRRGGPHGPSNAGDPDRAAVAAEHDRSAGRQETTQVRSATVTFRSIAMTYHGVIVESHGSLGWEVPLNACRASMK
jgi:hypothetical protein